MSNTSYASGKKEEFPIIVALVMVTYQLANYNNYNAGRCENKINLMINIVKFLRPS